MIKSFIHKGLQKFYGNGSTKGIQFEHSKKIKMRLSALDTAMIIEDKYLLKKNTNYQKHKKVTSARQKFVGATSSFKSF